MLKGISKNNLEFDAVVTSVIVKILVELGCKFNLKNAVNLWKSFFVNGIYKKFSVQNNNNNFSCKFTNMKKLFLLGLLLQSVFANAQLPETSIHTLEISRNRTGLVFAKPNLISNKKGYNNQPYFTPDGKYIYYASNNGGGNTDIYRHNLQKPKQKSKRITKTAEAEYSPRLKPDETEITCVRVEKDTVTQHFFAYNLEGKRGHLYLPKVENLGYYTWYTGVDIIGFTLPEPFLLSRFNTVTLRQDTIAISPGRTFQVFRNKIYYVDKNTVSKDSAFAIRVVAVENLRTQNRNKPKIENPIITYTLPKQEDFVIMNDGTFLMGSKGKLFSYNAKLAKKNNSNAWRELADFKNLGLANFYRLAISPDNTKLAVVSYSGAKP
jgi:hypothetical protein